MDAISGHTQPSPPITLTPGHAAIPRSLPVHRVGCASSPWPGKLLAASGASVSVTWEQQGLRQSSHRRGLEMAPIALVAAHPWLVILIFLNYWHFWWLKMEMQKLCPDFWVNTRLDTTRHNAGSNCWLQFAMVSSIKPFQDFTTNWPQLRR